MFLLLNNYKCRFSDPAELAFDFFPLISPQEVVAVDALDKIGRILKANGLTLEYMMERGRESRAKIIAKKYPRLAKQNRKK